MNTRPTASVSAMEVQGTSEKTCANRNVRGAARNAVMLYVMTHSNCRSTYVASLHSMHVMLRCMYRDSVTNFQQIETHGFLPIVCASDRRFRCEAGSQA